MDNIQVLFSSITMDNVRGYLLGSGWKVSSAPDASQLLMEGPIHDGGQPYRLIFPSTDEHPRFRDRVQVAVFNLSCIEDREPIEIAREMASAGPDLPEAGQATGASAVVAPQTPSATISFRLHNGQLATVDLEIESCVERFPLAAHESIDIVIPPGKPQPKISYGNRSITVTGCAGARAFQSGFGVKSIQPPENGQPAHAEPLTGAVAIDELLSQELNRHAARAADPFDVAAVATDLRPLLVRVEFELGSKPAAETLRRQAAVLAAALAKRLADEPNSATSVWRFVGRLLERGPLRLEIADAAIGELFSIARRDDELAPRETLQWLERRTE